MSWKILLGYLPTNAMRRQQTLKRKRAEYKEAIRQHYYIDDNSRTIQEQETLRQVLVDVPRTAPNYPLFRNERIKRALSRVLYTWAIRHPASSYVQGINDLATPLFAVFLSDDYEGEDVLDGSVMVVLEEDRLEEVRWYFYGCYDGVATAAAAAATVVVHIVSITLSVRIRISSLSLLTQAFVEYQHITRLKLMFIGA